MSQESGEPGGKYNDYGWKVRMDHKFSEKRNQYLRPRLKQLPDLIGMGFRYLLWYLKMRRQKRKPFIDGMNCLPVQQIYGVPLGGIGGGTIGRGFKGEFCRFQLVPGIYKHRTVLANQFIVCIRRNGTTVYQKVLSPLQPKKKLQAWDWGFDGSKASYRGLYPRAWYTYDIPEENIQLICRQVSPVIPHNYKDSSLPVAAFIWTVRNLGNEPAEVSITFTFKNGTGGRRDKNGGCWTQPFSETQSTLTAKGVLLYQKMRDIDCTVAISAAEEENVKVSHLVEFNPNGNGAVVWDDLKEDGCLNSSKDTSEKTLKGEEIASAVTAQRIVNGCSSGEMKFCLAWDMPTTWFKGNTVKHRRRYTRWFDQGQNAPILSAYTLANVSNWENAIEEWQNPILENNLLPDWYKSAIFNELYFISDGGSVWIEYSANTTGHKDLLPGDVRSEYGQFAYLEGHEYRMYNTYDVHFYASFALVMLWPKLQLSLQYDIMDATISEDKRQTKFLMNGNIGLRKSANSVPHDIGDPEEDPWLAVNSYFVHDTNEWKDLNTKFVLQVYRDYAFTKDEDYLKNMWPMVKTLMSKCLTWDTDGDGLIENSGKADQTYDSWIMSGVSAYCGGLWLAALCVTILMARKIGEEDIAVEYEELLKKAKESYDKKLWNDGYYKFQDRNDGNSFSIMSDQLCGFWYLKASGVTEEIIPEIKAKTTLKTIFENNVMKFKDGKMGAVNGMLPTGIVDTIAVQSEEVWVGVTYALAATMVQEGMIEEGMSTAEGMYTTIYDTLGLGFQTPEAVYAEKNCRSLGYMRPLSIWAIQWALQNRFAQS